MDRNDGDPEYEPVARLASAFSAWIKESSLAVKQPLQERRRIRRRAWISSAGVAAAGERLPRKHSTT
jgi:hypothetical protein